MHRWPSACRRLARSRFRAGAGPRSRRTAWRDASRSCLSSRSDQLQLASSRQRLAARYDGSEHWPMAAWTRDANLTLHADRNSVLFAPDTGRSDEYAVPAIDLASRSTGRSTGGGQRCCCCSRSMSRCALSLARFSPPTFPDWHQALPCSTSPAGPTVTGRAEYELVLHLLMSGATGPASIAQHTTRRRRFAPTPRPLVLPCAAGVLCRALTLV